MLKSLPGSSSLNFVAGIFAGAGINMITSVATGPESGVSTLKIAIDSAFWVLAAGFLTWAAQLLQSSERDADLQITPDLTPPERREVRNLHLSEALLAVRLPLGLTFVSLLAAVALLPRFIRWSALF